VGVKEDKMGKNANAWKFLGYKKIILKLQFRRGEKIKIALMVNNTEFDL
jgi:hypothetical protein